jgi:hypothetical protein
MKKASPLAGAVVPTRTVTSTFTLHPLQTSILIESCSYVFGWGRRFCQGTYIAEASLFIVLARIMWGIDFILPKDEKTSKPILPDINDETTFSDGFVSIPYTYKLGFKPRSEKHGMLIERSYEDSQAEWQVLGLETDER